MVEAYDLSAQSESVGFELGFDLFRIGYVLPHNFVKSPVEDGYIAARTQAAHNIIHPDIYDKKLIQIRMRAYQKGIPVSITKSDLEHALEVCRGECPVLGCDLTFSTGEYSDWSVDRIDNSIGYVPGNIFVMSSVVNRAKNDEGTEDIIKNVIMTPDANIFFYKGSLNEALAKEIPIPDEDYMRANNDFWTRLFSVLMAKIPDEPLAQATKNIYADKIFDNNDREESDNNSGAAMLFFELFFFSGQASKNEFIRLMKAFSVTRQLLSTRQLTENNIKEMHKRNGRFMRKLTEQVSAERPEGGTSRPYVFKSWANEFLNRDRKTHLFYDFYKSMNRALQDDPEMRCNFIRGVYMFKYSKLVKIGREKPVAKEIVDLSAIKTAKM